jgi:hypothetical protein
MTNLLHSPEQKLNTLINELRTPVEIIRGLAPVIRMEIESDGLKPAKLLNEINRIAAAADKIKELLDETVSS